MLQRAFKKSDKTAFLRKNGSRIGLEICAVVHEAQKINMVVDNNGCGSNFENTFTFIIKFELIIMSHSWYLYLSK